MTEALPPRTKHRGIAQETPDVMRIIESATLRSIAYCGRIKDGENAGEWEVFSLRQLSQVDNPTGRNAHFKRIGDAADYAAANFHADDHITHPDDDRQPMASAPRPTGLLGPGQAARHLGISPSTLRGLHARGRGPRPEHTLSGGRVYDRAELDRWDREDRRPGGAPRKVS